MWKSDHLPVVLDVEIPRRYTVSLAENIIQDINCYVDYLSGRIYFGDGAFLLSEITILDLLGHAVMRNQFVQSNSLDIGPLENGIYLFRITDKASIKTGKFIIVK
jgi:hypothetical protein